MTGMRADIVPYGERGWLATFTGTGDPVASGLAANHCADLLRAAAGIEDAVAGIDSVAIRFDPARINPETARMMLEKEIREAPSQASAPSSDPIVVPVFYGGEAGPDLADLAAHTGLPEQAVIGVHASKTYRVATLGFAPGFAYMGTLDEKLQVPRLPHPDAHLPAGSVGVAGEFTCIYPLPSPGGWCLIGRTPMRLFDPMADEPFALKPGASVQFRPISEEEFLAETAP